MTGRCVLITGAGGALGRGVTEAILAAGHAVVAVDRGQLDPQSVTGGTPDAGDRLEVLQGDALSPEFMEHAVDRARERFGRLDALIHLAGTYAHASLADTDLELWH